MGEKFQQAGCRASQKLVRLERKAQERYERKSIALEQKFLDQKADLMRARDAELAKFRTQYEASERAAYHKFVEIA